MRTILIILLCSALGTKVFSQDNTFESCNIGVRVKFEKDNTTRNNLVSIYIKNKTKEKMIIPANIRSEWVEGSGYLYIYWGEGAVTSTYGNKTPVIAIAKDKEERMQLKIKNVKDVIYTVTLIGNYGLVYEAQVSNIQSKTNSRAIYDSRKFYYYAEPNTVQYRYDINWYHVMRNHSSGK